MARDPSQGLASEGKPQTDLACSDPPVVASVRKPARFHLTRQGHAR